MAGLLRQAASETCEASAKEVGPEFPINWFTGLGVSDRFVYVADGSNRRVLRLKMDYRAQETVAVP